jgi:flagellar biosynthetic protein FlhB
MADQPASERTEEATPERLRKAREEGRIPQSQEVPSAIAIGVLLLALGLLGGWMCDWCAEQVQAGVTVRPVGDRGPRVLVTVLRQRAIGALTLVVPFLIAAAASSVFSSLVSSGWTLSPKGAQLRFDRISPVQGLKNLFSARSVVKLLITLLKLGVILGIVWLYLRDKLPVCYALRWTTAAGMLAGIGRLVFGLLARIAVAVLVIAGIDLFYQRRKYRKDLRMTRQEMKEERKQYEVSPETKGRIRGAQIEMVRKRMLQEVPEADVVLVNPTHFAVALRYDHETMDAPQLVAKGADLLAEKIKEIARIHGVPIIHRPELARTIYAAVDVGEPIPEALFVAVAEVLAMIYRLRKRRNGV